MSDVQANDGTPIGAPPASVLAYLDVVLVVLAAPVAIALGASPLGYLIAAGAWVLQRVLQQLDRRPRGRCPLRPQPGRWVWTHLAARRSDRARRRHRWTWCRSDRGARDLLRLLDRIRHACGRRA